MRVDIEKCIGCGKCVIFCPMDCIKIIDGQASVNEDECVECGVCLRTAGCPSNALFMPQESFEQPRVIRMQFSDPTVKHPKQATGGRGTEEAKTNDVTGKFGKGEFGLFFEFGRPNVGTRLSEIEKLTIQLQRMNIDILSDNPIYSLMEEGGSGRFKKKYINEKVLSAILEVRIVGEEKLVNTLKEIIPLLNTVNTVVSVGVVTRFDDEGNLPVVEQMERVGISVRPNAKINVGLGRPLIS